jgi:serine protease inhibitor ecotin
MKKTTLTLIIFAITILSYAQNNKVIIKLHSIEGYGQHEDFAKRACLALEKVINSEEFKNKVLDNYYLKTNNLSNQELYNNESP